MFIYIHNGTQSSLQARPALGGNEHTDGVTGNLDGTRETRSCARTYLQSTQYNPTPGLDKNIYQTGMRASAQVVPRLALLSTSQPSAPRLPKSYHNSSHPCSLESLARSPVRNVRTRRACLSAGHVDATPSPTRATALSAKDIDIGSRAGHGTSDTANRQTRDRDTRRWRARRGSVLFFTKSAMFSFIMRCEVVLLAW